VTKISSQHSARATASCFDWLFRQPGYRSAAPGFLAQARMTLSSEANMNLLRQGLLIIIFTSMSFAQQAPAPDAWSGWDFLVGEWTAGEGGGVPGQATAGYFSLTPDLNGRILLRKNHSEYAASNGRPAVVHDDLMIVYHEAGATKAFYDDSEGHVIHYDVSLASDGKRIIFLSNHGPSDQGAGQAQYRLTYEDLGQNTVKVVFEIAPPNKPNQFSKYVEGIVHRKSP
jgi:hypothetical protein